MKEGKELLDVWITHYALTSGIYQAYGAISDDYPEYFSVCNRDGRYLGGGFGKGQWFRTREEAVAKANLMRERKLESLKKQIKKLEVPFS